MSAPRTFEDIADAQGWNDHSRMLVLRDFAESLPEGSDLVAYAQARADEENGVPEGSSGKPVPDLHMDVTGTYEGDAYPASAEYRVNLSVLGTGNDFALVVENLGGGVVNSVILSTADADGIIRMASTDHSLAGYEDDWTIPTGMERAVTWDVGTGNDVVMLDEGQIDEIAAWLRYATGEDTWDWAENGSEWEF